MSYATRVWTIELAEANAEELDELTVALRRELLRELAVDARPTAVGPAPKDTKGDPFSIGILSLAVLPTLLPKLIEFSQQWVTRSHTFGSVKTRLKSCVTVKSSLGAAQYGLRFASSGSQVAVPSVQSTTLDAKTAACVANNLRALSASPALAGCTVDISVTLEAPR